MKKKVALVTGVTGQDGSYLAEFLLDKKYEVHAIRRRTSANNDERLSDLYARKSTDYYEHSGDLSDGAGLTRVINEVRPDEIYNLAAQSHVAVSFECAEYTADVDALGPLRLLEAVRTSGLINHTKFYQASTSELFGKVVEIPQSEKTPFYPRSPYGVAKLYAYWIVLNYREAYGMFACNGILFNHESPRRGENFVTRKITRAAARILLGLDKCLYLGNIDAMRDWGHARDYVEAQWLILQQDVPRDFVVSTGEQHSVREFVNLAFERIGVTIEWKGKGIEEVGIVAGVNSNEPTLLKAGDEIVKIDKQFYRPSEVDTLMGDPSYAHEVLGWKPKVSFESLVNEMVEEDVRLIKIHMRENGSL